MSYSGSRATLPSLPGDRVWTRRGRLFRIAIAAGLCWIISVAGFGASSSSAQTPKEPAPKPKNRKPAVQVVEVEQFAASHIQISYRGSAWAPRTIKRTADEARKVAQDLLGRLRRGEGTFEELAQEHSDDDSKDQDGFLGLFKLADMVPVFARATKKLEVGAISNVVETPFGFHIIRREPAIRASHVVIGYAGSPLSRSNKAKKITRSKEEALALASEVLEKARAPEADFAALARRYSEGPTGSQGGDLGTFSKGQYLPAFEQAALALEPGGISEIVETTYGYHVILRTK